MLQRVHKRFQKIMRHKTYGGVAQSILMTIAITGMISVAVIAPNTFRAVEAIGMRKKTYTLPYIKAVLHHLIRKGYVAEVIRDGHAYLTLTPKGQKRIVSVRKSKKQISKKQKQK